MKNPELNLMKKTRLNPVRAAIIVLYRY